VQVSLNDNTEESDKREDVAWHGAAYELAQLEFQEYRSILEYKSEHQLTKEPLRIDVVIIKKKPGIKIEKNIGRIFRDYNILEYKSPEDSLTRADYYKGFAYAFLYSMQEGIDIDDMTISYIVTRHPRDLLTYIRSKEYLKVTRQEKGIHYIEGAGTPIQIIESQQVSEEENLWIKALSNHIEAQTMEKVFVAAKEVKGIPVQAYLNAIMKANPDVLAEVLKMKTRTYEEVLKEFGYVNHLYVEAELAKAEERVNKAEEKMSQAEEKVNKAEEKVSQAEEKVSKVEEERAKEREKVSKSIKEMLILGVAPEKISQSLEIELDEVLSIQSKIQVG
jgi:hypothetical protein